MEFKFRSVDERPLPPPTRSTYFTLQRQHHHQQHHALRGVAPPFTSTLSTQPNTIMPSPSIFRNPDVRLNPDPIHHSYPRCLREAMTERQLEKDRIREEIIAAEIVRRRILEAEVRRELMLEVDRDTIALRRTATATTTDGLAFGFDQDRRFASSSLMRFDPARLQQQHYSFDDNRSSAFFASHTPSAPSFEAFSLRPRLPQPVPAPPAASASDLNNNNNNKDNKDKLIMLAKPAPNLSGVKRKTPPAVGVSELPPFGLKKNPKEEWSCALCRVSASSEKGLNQHVNGKKHKAKEAGLRAQKVSKSSSNAPLSKRAAKFSEPKHISRTASSELEAKEIRESLDHNKTGDDLDKKMQDAGTSQEEKEELLMQKDQCGEHLKNKDDAKIVQRLERTEEVNKKKKYKFWCERCKVGAHSPKVMSAHMSGKKHFARRQELAQNNVPIASSMDAGIFSCALAASASSASLLASDAAKEAHEKIPTATGTASSGANEKVENAYLTKEADK